MKSVIVRVGYFLSKLDGSTRVMFDSWRRYSPRPMHILYTWDRVAPNKLRAGWLMRRV